MQGIRLFLPASLIVGAALAPAARTTQDPVVESIEAAVEIAPVLEDHMLDIQTAVKKLRRSLRDPEKAAESLEWVVKAEHAALAAKAMDPHMLENVPEAKRPEFLREYRKEMVHLIDQMLVLEVALLDGDADAANEAFAALRALEDPAHERFTEGE